MQTNVENIEIEAGNITASLKDGGEISFVRDPETLTWKAIHPDQEDHQILSAAEVRSQVLSYLDTMQGFETSSQVSEVPTAQHPSSVYSG